MIKLGDRLGYNAYALQAYEVVPREDGLFDLKLYYMGNTFVANSIPPNDLERFLSDLTAVQGRLP